MVVSETLDRNKQISRRPSEELWNQGNLDAADELLSPDFVFHTPAEPAPVRGVEGYKAFVGAMRSAFPDVQTTIEDIVAEGDAVALRVRMRMTQLGPYQGIPATGTEIHASQILIDHLSGGKIVESWQEVNAVGMLEQLGIVPSRDAGPLRTVAWMFGMMGRFARLELRARLKGKQQP